MMNLTMTKREAKEKIQTRWMKREKTKTRNTKNTKNKTAKKKEIRTRSKGITRKFSIWKKRTIVSFEFEVWILSQEVWKEESY